MTAKHQGQAEYQCPKCNEIVEFDNGWTVKCQKCGIKMEKVWGGRANNGGHDFRHQDN